MCYLHYADKYGVDLPNTEICTSTPVIHEKNIKKDLLHSFILRTLLCTILVYHTTTPRATSASRTSRRVTAFYFQQPRCITWAPQAIHNSSQWRPQDLDLLPLPNDRTVYPWPSQRTNLHNTLLMPLLNGLWKPFLEITDSTGSKIDKSSRINI